CYDSNDDHPGRLAAESNRDALPDRVFARPVMLRQILVDDRHLKSGAIVILLEVVALKDGDIHRLKISGKHHAIGAVGLLAPFWDWLAFNEEWNAPDIACEWKMVDGPNGRD